MKKILSVLSLIGCLFAAQAQSLPIKPNTPFKIYDTHTSEQITITELSDRLGKTDVFFWGEEHNDTIGHILELKMLKLLSERYQGKLMLSLEMFETDCQVLLDEYLGGFISKEKFSKEVRLWDNYEDYSPMVEYAKAQHIPIVAANSPRRYNSLMSQRGPKSLDSLGDNSKEFIAKLPIYVPKKGKYYDKFVSAMGGADNIHSPNMFASQCLWDATMANSIERAHSNSRKGGIVMHVCGRFHSDEGLGTVAQLRRKNKDLKITTISCVPADDFGKPNRKDYEPLADFVILTKKSGE
ncbi:MAG: ChaN family lipoprotein [Phycisphaerales bacterium]|nr:ChaN family lipoprotein [Phycisphaerales bacterium]